MSFGRRSTEFRSPWETEKEIPTAHHPRSPQIADDIDFEIKGAEMQFLEVELDPGETVISEAGAMMFKDPDVEMSTIFGDGSQESAGLMDKIFGAGKRVITGESLFITAFKHLGNGKARVAFAAPYPGNILPFRLDEMGGTLICQRDAFLCAARGVKIGIAFQKRIMTGLFGGEGFIMQKLEGDGWVFVHAGGTLIERELAEGDEVHVDSGCIVAYTQDIDFDLVQAGSVKSMIFGGEGLFFARLRGPGKVWLQSLPLSRLAGRIGASVNRSSDGGGVESTLFEGVGGVLKRF